MASRTHKAEDERGVVLASYRELAGRGGYPSLRKVSLLARIGTTRTSEILRELSESGELDEPEPTEAEAREIEARIEAARRRKASEPSVEVPASRLWVEAPRSRQRIAM